MTPPSLKPRRQRLGQQDREHAYAQREPHAVKRIVVGHDLRLLVRNLTEFAQRRRRVAELFRQRRQPLRHLRVGRHDRFA